MTNKIEAFPNKLAVPPARTIRIIPVKATHSAPIRSTALPASMDITTAVSAPGNKVRPIKAELSILKDLTSVNGNKNKIEKLQKKMINPILVIDKKDLSFNKDGCKNGAL